MSRKQPSSKETEANTPSKQLADLQYKIEQYERNAAVEAALDKVRGASMAMYKSEDVSDAVAIIFQELESLEIAMVRCGLGIFSDKRRTVELWTTTSIDGENTVQITGDEPLEGHPLLNMIYDNWKPQKDFSYTLQGDDLHAYHDVLATTNFQLPDSKLSVNEEQIEYYRAAYFTAGGLYVFANRPFTEDALRIIRRFADVFHLTYTRYQDLQKVEAQAREAQIEAALERVRAEGLAMHKTDQLQDVVNTVNTQLQTLRLDLDGTLISIKKDNKDKTLNSWVNTRLSDARYSSLLYYDGKLHTNLIDFLAEGEGLQSENHETENVVKWYKQIFKSQNRNKAAIKSQNILLESIINYVRSSWACPLTMMTMIRFSGRDFTDDEHQILERFAKVFEQTYTRFLDIQKAEAQTKEARIEAALERVRAASMAMHSSDGLLEVTHVLRQQMALLGEEELESILIHSYSDDSDTFEAWYTYLQQDGDDRKLINDKAFINWNETARARIDRKMYLSDESDYTIVADYKMLKEWYTYIHGIDSGVVEVDENGKIIVPKSLYYNYSKFTDGALLLVTNDEASDQSKHLLQRAAEVFNLAYTRFLDLQKAEAQTREAQIEAALERVRSTSMAMHKSEELPNVLSVMFKEFEYFNNSDEFRDIELFIIDEATGDAIAWASDQNFQNAVTSYPFSFLVTPGAKKEYLAWKKTPIKKRKDLVISSFYKEKSWEKVLSDFEKVEELKEIASTFRKEGIKEWATHHAYFSHGTVALQQQTRLITEDVEILQRFAKVFEQTYTRFLDLQKAEAQAREAQIEAALERVRAASMAMHQSDELREVVATLYQQLYDLGFDSWECNIVLEDKDRDGFVLMMSHNEQSVLPDTYFIPHFDHPIYNQFLNGFRSKKNYFTVELAYEHKRSYDKHVFSKTDLKLLPAEVKKQMRSLKESYAFSANFKYGYLQALGQTMLSDQKAKILQRFASVFNQSYTRFLDLQKAEAQAKEAQIEAALERVRARTMAMHQTEDLSSVVGVLYEQVQALNLANEGCNINIFKEDINSIETWMAGFDGISLPECYYMEGVGHPYLKKMWKSWRTQKDLFHISSNGKELKNYATYILEETDLKRIPDDFKEMMLESPEQHFSFISFKYGQIEVVNSTAQLSQENAFILSRFAKVFEQTYTRFLDLARAQAQAREAQIEAALERVRARSMWMQQSHELRDVVSVMYEEMESVGLAKWGCQIMLCHEDKELFEFWLIEETDSIHKSNYFVKGKEHPVYREIWMNWENQTNPFILHHRDEYKLAFDKYWLEETDFKHLPDEVKASVYSRNEVFLNYAPMKHGLLNAISFEKPSDKLLAILGRFSKVFEQTYTRFLDLQKSENQAREAQIEAALEKVRSSSLAMHTTDELQAVIYEVFQQLNLLGITMDVSFLEIFDHSNDTNIWVANPKHEYAQLVHIPYNKNSIMDRVLIARNNKEAFFTDEYGKRDKNKFYRNAFKNSDLKNVPQSYQEEILEKPGYTRSMALTEHAGLAFFNLEKNAYSDEDNELLIRFSKVFNQAYRRFLDIKKAETQAREARVEAGLERIRAKTMAMHSSDELRSVINALYRELIQLDVNLDRCILLMVDPNTEDITWWLAGKEGLLNENGFLVQNNRYKSHRAYIDGWKNKRKKWQYHFYGREKRAWDNYAFTKTGLSELPDFVKNDMAAIKNIHLSISSDEFGCLVSGSFTPLTDFQQDIISRISTVFNLTYTRFLDLKKAEAQAREAQIEAALERVRARAMAMHNSDELSEAAELLYSEFKKLGIIPYSCGYVINDDQINRWQVWMTDANDDSFKTVWTLPYDADKYLKERYTSWERKEVFHATVLEGEENAKHHRRIADFAPQKESALGTLPNKLVLSSAHFEQGHLLIVTPDELEDEIQHILIRFAKVFEQTYTRFLDLQKAEEQASIAKKQSEEIEKAYENLKATQTQLIQAEKMASLGELTAGIAHEIQNPLNFVNNFSDVSGEMIDEAFEELNNNDVEEVKEILTDLKGNLEKISHHGNRASSIVKGMLDHSRIDTGEKVPTDINALCDEYLRLSYHGLRAKDKSFNCAYETHFDEGITLIEVVPQDIGRVLLNIINNAFYACTERSRSAVNEKSIASAQSPTPSRRNVRESKGESAHIPYKPLVSITTRSAAVPPPQADQGASEAIEIKIKDNGIGMSQETIDKVFQPFFTTKPTGQGTGLGMSISYDIVTKGHGGELRVESEEGVGTTFIVSLPTIHS